MSLTLGLAVYFICWWLTLFMVLPFGVKTQKESGKIVPGSAESAPEKPNLFKKMLATTLIASIFFGIIYWLLTVQPIAYEDIPFLPQF